MAKRPVFIPQLDGPTFVDEPVIEFTWYPGFSKTQAQKSINSLHSAASEIGIVPILEISSKSSDPVGIALSAFNLKIFTKARKMSVECAFQGSKIFMKGGPFIDLYEATSRNAKTDDRIRNSGPLIEFDFLGDKFPTKPMTAFYDWLYIFALSQNPFLHQNLERFHAFSDIAFNPDKSINCQARSAALFVAIRKKGLLEHVLEDKNFYLKLITNENNSSLGNKGQSKQLKLY